MVEHGRGAGRAFPLKTDQARQRFRAHRMVMAGAAGSNNGKKP
jgi:hypothetical protein